MTTEQKKGMVTFISDGSGEDIIATIKVEEPLLCVLKSVCAMDKEAKEDRIDCGGNITFKRYQLRRWFSDSISAEHRVLFTKELLDTGSCKLVLQNTRSAERLFNVIVGNISNVFTAITSVQKASGKVQVTIG